MPKGLVTRQAKLTETLANFERSRRSTKDGLSTNELARKVFGRKFTPTDRAQTSRALNALAASGMTYRAKRGGLTAYWRIHPRIVVR